jgi:SdpI/YfhL protein family
MDSGNWHWHWWNWGDAEIYWLFAVCILTAVTSVPLALRLVPPNALYGFKTRFTRSNPAVWYDANAFVGRGMIAASIVSATILAWHPIPFQEAWMPAAIVVVPIMLVTLAGFVYLRHLRESHERR